MATYLIDDAERSLILCVSEEHLKAVCKQVDARNDAAAKLLLNSIQSLLKDTSIAEAYHEGGDTWNTLMNQLLLYHVSKSRVNNTAIPILDRSSIPKGELQRIEKVKAGGRVAGKEYRS